MTPTKLPTRLSFFVLLVDLAIALLQNVTVDDAAATGTLPQYLPSPSWTQGATCSGCGAQPDPSLAFNGTWHDTTFTPGDGIAKAIELTFSGSAIYVFFILANTIEFVDTVTDMNFIVDEVPVATFVHTPTTSTDFEYNVPVYVNESLSDGQHHIRMEAAGNHSALVLFDYLVYTSDVDETATSLSSSLASSSLPSSSAPLETQSAPSKSVIASIVGGALGGIIALSLLCGIILCYWKRRRHGRGAPKLDRIMTREAYGDEVSLSSSARNDIDAGTLPRPYRMVAESSDDITAPSDHQRLYSKGRTMNPDESRQEGLERLQLSNTLSSSSDRPDNLPVVQHRVDDATMLRERVELLMDEVVRLRHLHENAFETDSEGPPGYSEGQAEPDP